MSPRVISLVAGFFLAAHAVHAANFTRGEETAAQFGLHEITLTGDGAVANPQDTLATVTFTPPSGAANAVTVHAFHDGGDTWRARAYIDEIGAWSWTSASATDAGLDARSGTFTAVASTLRGKLVKHPADSKAWATDDGRWFLNISDTAYYLFNPAVTVWQQFVADNAALGVTSVRANLAGALRQFEKQQPSDGWDRIFADGTRDTLNLGALQTDDARLEWMLNHHPDIHVQIIVTPEPNRGWGQDENFWSALSSVRRERFLRNVVARYAAWPQLFWLVTNDAFHGSSFPNNNAMVSEIGAYLAANDPWKHKNLRSSGRNRDATFHFTTAPWVSYIHLETTTALSANQVDAYTASPMHVFNGEDWYEDERSIANDAYFFRRLFWAWTLSGASANYGGYWRTIVPYGQTDFTGLDDVIHLKTFFPDHDLELAGFVPVDARATGPTGVKRVKVMRRPDDSAFVLYHPNAAADGGSASLADGAAGLTLTDLAAGPRTLRWMRADTGATHDAGVIVHAGGDLALTAPWSGVDVVAYLKNHDAVKLILDTDFRTDVDDPGTLAMIHGLADLGHVDLIGVVATTAGSNVVRAIDAVNTHRGRPDIPIALIASSLASGGDDPYAPAIGNPAVYPNDQTNAGAPDSTAYYRATLHAAADHSIHIAVVGGQNAIRALMRSEANHNGDGIPFTGMELIQAKLAGLTIMGGRFNSTSYEESNIKRGIAAAQDVAAAWPTPIVYVGWEVGTGVGTGAALTNPAVNPVARAYEIFWGSGGAGNIGNRDSWDQTATLYAVAGQTYGGQTLWNLSAPHDITFGGSGKTIIAPNPDSTRYYLIKQMPDAGIATIISDLMTAAPGAPPPPPPPPPDPPSSTDAIAHYTFDETAGAADPGNPIVNRGGGGASLNLTDTGGPDGRNNTGSGGYGAAGLAGFGTAFDVLASGDGTRHSATGGSPVGGGLTTAAAVPQSALQGADGAFTYEALIRIAGTTEEQTILSHDGSSTRGFLFRVTGGKLSLYTGAAEATATIPTSGAHAFAAGQWFHVAVAYTGAEGVAGNLRFYWTALAATPAPTEANLVGTATLAADLAAGATNLLGVGTTTRSPFRFELGGLIDDVRISGVAHSPNSFAIFAPPAPVTTDTSGDGIPDAWATAHGLDPEIDNRHGDADGDGIPNLLEYALGLDPNTADPVALPAPSVENDFLTLTITRNPDAADLLFTPEVSADLVTWDSAEDQVVVVEDTPTTLRVRDSQPVSTSPRRFMRLRVQPMPTP